MSKPVFLGTVCIDRKPTKDGFSYICRASYTVEGMNFCECGEGATLESASHNAKTRAFRVVQEFVSKSSSESQTTAPVDKSSMNGGGNKPASEKQLNFLYSQASRAKENLEDIVRQKFGKDIGDLTGSEAHELIRSLT